MYFSTNGIAQTARRDAWLDAVRAQCGDFDIQFSRGDFDASLDVRKAGPFRCARIMQTSRQTTRLEKQVDTKTVNCYFAVLQITGRSIVEQFGRSAELSEGDIAIIDANAPMSQRYSGRNVQLSLHVPKSELHTRSLDWQPLAATRLERSWSTLVGPLICSAFDAGSDFDDVGRAAIGDTLVSLLSLGRQLANSEGKDRTALPLSLESFILSRLDDEHLSPAMVARENGLSERQVHRIFKSTGRTISNWIRQNRLDRCAADLRDPNKKERTITQIAFSWGFNDAAHFSRVFSAEYGYTPRDYRIASIARTEAI